MWELSNSFSSIWFLCPIYMTGEQDGKQTMLCCVYCKCNQYSIILLLDSMNISIYIYVVASCIFNLSLYKSCHFQIIREIGFTRHYTNTDLSKISIPFLSCQKTSEHKHSWFLNPHSHLHYPLKMTYTKMKLFFQNPCPFEYHNYIISKENFNIAWFVSKKVSMKWILPSKNDLPWKINFPDFANKPPFSAILHPYSEVRYVYQLTMGLCTHYKNSCYIYGT